MLNRTSFTLGLVAVVVVIMMVGGVLFLGVPLRIDGLNIGGQRMDSITATDMMHLIRQDASQRAILVTPKSPNGHMGFFACSEPPPDVAQDLAHSLDASLRTLGKGNDVEGQVSAKISEDLRVAAELLFQRSQGVQLLRDIMFRMCEALQNGVLAVGSYQRLFITMIKVANFVIPFEQCTRMLERIEGTGQERGVLLSECLHTARNFASELGFESRAMPSEP